MEINEILCNIYLEFVECLIHSILYIRGIYPAYLFESRLKYDITVNQCKHPDINNYIKRVLEESKILLLNGLVSNIHIVVSDGVSNTIIDLISISTKFNIKNNNDISKHVINQLEELLRSTLLKATILDSKLKNLSKGCTWEIIIETESNDNNTSSYNVMKGVLTSGNWHTNNSLIPNDNNTEIPVIIPIKSFQNDLMDLSLFARVINNNNQQY